jgi:hypothetical protein
MPRQTTRAGDVTGREKAKLAEQHKAELDAREGEITLINSRAAEAREQTVDLTGDEKHFEQPVQPEIVQPADEDKVQAPAPRPATTPGVEVVEDEVEVQEVEAPVKIREFRVNEDLENVTIGQGTNYNFYEGTKYRAPSHIYDHLEEKGYIWH